MGLGGRGRRRRNIGQNHGGAKDCGGVKRGQHVARDKASAEEKVRDRVGRRCTPEGVMVKLALVMNWEKKTPQQNSTFISKLVLS